MVRKGLLLCLILFGFNHAEMKEACEVVYKGDLNDLNDSTVVVPEVSVAFSGIIKIVTTIDSITGGSPPSIFFIIDQSGSMHSMDETCQRYAVASWMVDTLMTIYPNAEVGAAMFSDVLELNPDDDSIFV